jgi:3-methyladenine DNA glycosylase AlkD
MMRLRSYNFRNQVFAMKPPTKKPPPSRLAAEFRRMLKARGSARHAAEVQRFFKEEIKSYGWRTANLRRTARRLRRGIKNDHGLNFLLQIADQLFSGPVLEEKIFAVLLLENLDSEFGDPEFKLFESWLDRITNWSDHDSLAHCLLGPLVAADPKRTKNIFRWSKSSNRWHRRAACVALIRGTRARMFFPEITRLADSLLADQDDMVQKGLGWLLRETAKFDASRTIPYLMTIRQHAPRLVLRTACEKLPLKTKKQILFSSASKNTTLAKP